MLADGTRAFDDGDWQALISDAGSGSGDRPPGGCRGRNEPDQRLGEGEPQKKIRANPTLRKQLRIARIVGRSYASLLRSWGEELPAWEASLDLDPPAEERLDNAAWQIARAARFPGAIYRSEFDGTEKPPAQPQSPEDMAKEAAKIAARWGTKPKHEGTKPAKI